MPTGNGTAGGDFAGGLVGLNDGGTITNCYRHYNGGDCLNGTYVSDRLKFRDIAFLTATTPDDGLHWPPDSIGTEADPATVWRAFTYKGQDPIFQRQSFGTGTMQITSAPAGADISFNGVATGKTTNTTVSDLPEGEYNATVELGDVIFSPAFSVVLLAADETKTVAFTRLYSGGSGASDDPYQISTRDDLISLGADSAHWDNHFIVTNDISFAAGSPTETIGNGSSAEYYFNGTFDGQGHTISDFVMDKSSSDYIGFFGYLGSGAEIKNLRIAAGDAGVSGHNYVGVLAGCNYYSGTITNCSATGNATADSYAGGLVGSNAGTITNCSATGNATAGNYAGGFVGVNTGTITDCSATGSATASSNYAAGLVGYNYDGSITRCSAIGSAAAGSNYAGGLVGSSLGSITTCYATGCATAGSGYAGGLVGYSERSITTCYATGNATAGSYAGGLVGRNWATITNCYATGSATAGSGAGGLVGASAGTITNGYRHYTGGDCLNGTFVSDRLKFRDIAFLTGTTPDDGLQWSADSISTDADSATVWRAFTYKGRHPIFQRQSFGTGTMQINSAPAGANVSFNGVATGRATNTTASDLPEGEYNVTVEKDGYAPGAGIATVTAGTIETVEFTLISHPSAPLVTDPAAEPAVIPTNTDGSPNVGEMTVLSVTVVGTDVTSVAVNLSAIGDSPAAAMTGAGNGTWTVTTVGTVASLYAGGAYQPTLLAVNATSTDGVSNTTVSIPLTVVKNGDANENNRVTLYDAVYTARHLLEPEDYPMTESVGEVSGDGTLSIHDAMYLAKHVLAIPGYEQLH